MHPCRPFAAPPQPRTLAVGVAIALLPIVASAAPNVEFDPKFLQGSLGDQLDLSRFERGEDLPGTYSADIKVNGNVVARRDVELREMPDGRTVLCLSPQLVEVFGINRTRLPRADAADKENAEGRIAAVRPLPDGSICDDLSSYVPQARVVFDAGEQVLDVSIPQAYLSRDPRGWVSPELWDQGITAGQLGYSISHQRINSQGQARQTTSAVLNTGLNVGAWRFRHDGFFSQGSNNPARYRAGRTYAERNIATLGLDLIAGESSTQGDLFEGVNFRGASVNTDARMLPDSQREYAPIIRGVAQTNAQVIIRQRDYVLYQTSVAAGPFEIDDLYGTAYAGDLDVSVIESDGRVQRFTVPFAAVPQLLRQGQQRVGVTAALLNDSWVRDNPGFVEATVRRGLSNTFTGYGGVTATRGYGAIILGGALNTSLGALGGDITLARASLADGMPAFSNRMSGQSYRLTYSKNIDATATNIAMAAYRYSTDGYLTLSEALRLRQDLADGFGGEGIARQRSRIDLTINQRLGDKGGSLYANGSSITYWNLQQRRTNFAVGYSGTVGLASFSVSAQRSRERNLFGQAPARESNSVNLNVTVPLGRTPEAPRFSGDLTRSNNGRQDIRTGVTGNFGDGNQGSYNASASRNSGQSTGLDAGMSYQARAASVSAGISRSSGSRGLSLGASGGVLVHEGGVTLAQQLGDTIGIVQVPNAVGAAISSSVGVKTDHRGYAVVPYLQPYRRNEITVDPKGLPLDVELKSASALSVPTAGAVVRMVIPTESGRSALIEAPQVNGKPLPFGLDVYNEAGVVVGVVGQASRLWVRGIEQAGRLTVRWGQQAGQTCSIDYDLATANTDGMIAGTCRGVGDAP